MEFNDTRNAEIDKIFNFESIYFNAKRTGNDIFLL